MSRAARPEQAASCPFCLSWGVFRRADSCCRGCYDFGRTYPGGECAGCGWLIAVKNGYCRARITAADLIGGRPVPAAVLRRHEPAHRARRPAPQPA